MTQRNGNFLCSWIEKKNNVVKRNILNKIIYRFNTIPIKISVEYFTELEQIFQTLYRDTKDPE